MASNKKTTPKKKAKKNGRKKKAAAAKAATGKVEMQALKAFASDIFNPGQAIPTLAQPSGFQSLGAQGGRRTARGAPKPRRRKAKKKANR